MHGNAPKRMLTWILSQGYSLYGLNFKRELEFACLPFMLLLMNL